MFPTRTIPGQGLLTSTFSALLVASGACADAGTGECALAGECSSVSRVDFDTQISGPYTMVVETENVEIELRCNAPDDLTTEDNPEWATCDAGGFEIEGDEATLSSSLTVSIYVDDLDDYYVIGEIVDLTISATLEPNGAGCEPICFERNGALLGPL